MTDKLQVAEVFAPSQNAIDDIKSWLSENGIDENQAQVSKGLHWIRFNATISEVEALLRTEYKMFSHEVTGKPVLGCDEYSIPEFLKVSLSFYKSDETLQTLTLYRNISISSSLLFSLISPPE